MADKVTRMKLKVDLQCPKCYKKVLSRIPQIRGQEFDDKNNVVNITVVCCDPEKIRDKICCKGGGSIKSIEIVKPPVKPPDNKRKPDPDPGPNVPQAPPPKKPDPAPGPNVPPLPPPGMWVVPWYDGRAYFHGFGQLTIFCDVYYGRPLYDCYCGGGRPYCVSRCRFDQYFNEENPNGCSIM